MDIQKQTQVEQGGVPDQAQLAAVNALAKGKMEKDQVYVFSLRLCDDQVDRDYERFDTLALPELARMFVGKTGTVDHKWSAESQLARIFSTQVEKQADVSYIKAWAYIRRGGRGDEWIADIEAGIKKEISVGCSMGRCVCSICGSEYGSCGHRKGQEYEGQVCCGILREPMDAYEFSFVAVPAQREAGVLKAAAGRLGLKELAWRHGAQEEYTRLKKMAALGQEYAGMLAQEVVRLCGLLELEVEPGVLKDMVGLVAPEELKLLKEALEKRVSRRYPIVTQLSGQNREQELESGFLI